MPKKDLISIAGNSTRDKPCHGARVDGSFRTHPGERAEWVWGRGQESGRAAEVSERGPEPVPEE